MKMYLLGFVHSICEVLMSQDLVELVPVKAKSSINVSLLSAPISRYTEEKTKACISMFHGLGKM